jgi:hypothetical protein
MRAFKTFHNACTDNLYHLNHYDVLYELNNSNFSWIADIIFEYNKLGFLTFTSQPGISQKTTIYKSAYHRHYEYTDHCNILYQNGIRQQRAYIRGYMKRSMAKYIVSNLLDDEFLFARSENVNNIAATFEIKLGSVNFYENIPMDDKMHSISCTDDLKYIPDANASFSFDLPLRRPYKIEKEYDIIDIDDIVEFDILDTRWDNNDYLWKKLRDSIKKYFAQCTEF